MKRAQQQDPSNQASSVGTQLSWVSLRL